VTLNALARFHLSNREVTSNFSTFVAISFSSTIDSIDTKASVSMILKASHQLFPFGTLKVEAVPSLLRIIDKNLSDYTL
jgi:hypothetical protein